MTPRAPRAVAAVAFALLLLPLAACSAGASSPADDPAAEAPTAAESSAPADDAASDPASGETFGCTRALFDYVSDLGSPKPVALDPATFEIPSVDFAETPDCYLVDDSGGAEHYSAFWSADPQGVLTGLGASLDAAGYVQSDEYGPLIWWMGGDDPLTAESTLTAASQPIEGIETLWATWS
jgi:hypothetical protein